MQINIIKSIFIRAFYRYLLYSEHRQSKFINNTDAS